MWDQSGDTEAEMLEMEEMRREIHEMKAIRQERGIQDKPQISVPQLGFPIFNH